MQCVRQSFSIDIAYKQALSVVLKHFLFFVVALLFFGAAALVFLVAIGVFEWSAWHDKFAELIQTGVAASSRETGLVGHSSHDLYMYVARYMPASFARHLQLASQHVQDIKYADIAAALRLLIPVGVVIKLLVDLVMVGLIKCSLVALDNQEVHVWQIFTQARYVLYYVLVNLLVHIAVLIGCLAFILPGVFIYQRLRFAKYFVIDQDMNSFAALHASWNATCANELHLISYSIFAMMIAAFSHIVFVLLPLLMPLNMVADISVYRQLKSR